MVVGVDERSDVVVERDEHSLDPAALYVETMSGRQLAAGLWR